MASKIAPIINPDPESAASLKFRLGIVPDSAAKASKLPGGLSLSDA
jgi:hypothetical protein